MALSIRSATPDDAEVLARASLVASRAHLNWGLYDVALPLDDAGRLELLAKLARLDNLSFHSHQQRFIAEVDGEPAGSISAFVTGDEADAALGAAVFAAVPPDLLGGIGAARETFGRAAIPHPSGILGLELAAVFPEFRGRGVAETLLSAALERGRRAGLGSATLIYEIGNEPAAASYRRAGFRDVETRRDSEFERVFRSPGTIRAERALP